MLTPVFQLDQNNTFVYFCIKAPYCNISETEIFVENNEFKFFSKPYFLRLNLPGDLVEDGRESAKYEGEKGEFNIKFPKKIPGEVFEGLDLLTKLLTPKGELSASQPLLEIIGSNPDVLPSELLETDEIDWYIDQKPCTDNSIIGQYSYGFADKKSQVFKNLSQELKYIIDIKDPDDLSNVERIKNCSQQEADKFNEDHYLADLYQDEVVVELVKVKPYWSDLSYQDKISFNDKEREQLCNLPKKEYLLDENDIMPVYLSLVDIIYSYCYNQRITEGENNVESGWNICKLSSTLSWFCYQPNIKETIITCLRRSLTFPLYRNWKLAIDVLKDTEKIFSLGKRQILKCLLDIHSLFIDEDSRYILNNLYITDYCVWIQVASDKLIQSLSSSLHQLHITKTDVGLNLEDIESAARLVMEEEISSNLNNLTVNDSDDDDDESGSESSSESDSESDSSQNPDSDICTQL
ncbi:hypothetical protein LOTGIDRAFT_233998 [Lottia gigantea]|uniref:Protein SHQ1 homolog n=1 Tax=Lottia gigantea TaxID=225164 RepID=V4A4G6_LOTGI|nr:hypothetical protein LOTGIDRAFT_233998 [Lottia gigantea]ESO89850.1 hypothetical protein LOTGIDRAFT_233998 [Lottia gigantea]